MSHQIHHTEGFVLGSKNVGEANKYFTIYTKDFGLIRAVAQGIRKLESKLRFSLQDYSYIRLDLVQGREVWKITNAEKIASSEKIHGSLGNIKMLGNLFRLISRLCHGEEKNEDLFNHLIETYSVFENHTFDFEELKNFECVSVVRILHSLGYIASGESVNFFITTALDQSSIKEVGPVRRQLISEINKSLKETQL